MERPNRSSLQTTKVSPGFSTARHWSNPGRWDLALDILSINILFF
jgi:hypothetical protein